MMSDEHVEEQKETLQSVDFCIEIIDNYLKDRIDLLFRFQKINFKKF